MPTDVVVEPYIAALVSDIFARVVTARTQPIPLWAKPLHAIPVALVLGIVYLIAQMSMPPMSLYVTSGFSPISRRFVLKF